MWLINVKTYKLEYKQDANQYAGRYAILSHRWESGEVTHGDMIGRSERRTLRDMQGWYKIAKCCERANQDGLAYAWVDTCCIDKTSSAELQEALNSMYMWYQQAKVCYVYLSDVIDPRSGRGDPSGQDFETQLRESQWFLRGWTLQELVAPSAERFYDRYWTDCGSRTQHRYVISEITRIPSRYLAGLDPKWVADSSLSVAEIMSWAAGRRTARLEDRAYSLLGLFGVSMPLLYGEGVRAFRRLQEELLRSRDDQSVFAWQRFDEDHTLSTSLADSPDNFAGPPKNYIWLSPTSFERRKPHSVTNEGINIELLLRAIRPGVYHAVINAVLAHEKLENDAAESRKSVKFTHRGAAFPIREIDIEGRFVRMLPKDEETLYFPSLPLSLQQYELRQITLVNYLKQVEVRIAEENEPSSLHFDKIISDSWIVDDVNTVRTLDPSLEPEQRPWKPPVAEDIGCDSAASVAALLTWNGWPHKLKWDVKFIIRTLAFGFDRDFNPFCLVYTGWHRYDRDYLNQVNQYASEREGFTQKREAYDETAKIFPSTVRFGQHRYWLPVDLPTTYASSTKQIAFMVKATPRTRLSGEGVAFTINFDTSPGSDYYGGGSVSIKISRNATSHPWDVAIDVEHVQDRPIWKGIAPKHRRLVAPFPARRLGTWAEQKASEDANSTHDKYSVGDGSIL